MALGILAVGTIFIAGTFPLGIQMTAVAAERTIAAVVVDEAFAKIKLYGVDVAKLPHPGEREYGCVFFDEDIALTAELDANEFTYPSVLNPSGRALYCWSALCRDLGNSLVQVTVFICRKTARELQYSDPHNEPRDWGEDMDTVSHPMPVRIKLEQIEQENGWIKEFKLGRRSRDIPGTIINGGSVIVARETGRIMRVLERYKNRDDYYYVLAEEVRPEELHEEHKEVTELEVWVVAPAIAAAGGDGVQLSCRYPCIGVFQKVMRF